MPFELHHSMSESVLTATGISVEYQRPSGYLTAVDQASLALERGTILGIVGESGSGKSQLALSLTGLQGPSAVVQGSVIYNQIDLLASTEKVRQRYRGSKVAYVFQDPMNALNPYLRIGTQLREVAMQHNNLNRRQAEQRAMELMTKLHLPDVAERMRNFPHELSGGMLQRVMIAMALICAPDVLIADEPTTALDVTVQVQVLDTLRKLCDQEGLAVLLISHDMSVIARIADQAMVMYAGRVVEHGSVIDVLKSPRHPYTRGLLKSIPSLDQDPDDEPTGIPGQLPDMTTKRNCCLFIARCQFATQHCRESIPLITQGAEKPFSNSSRISHQVACFHPLGGDHQL